MAGNGIIGALLVSLGIDTAAFTTGLQEAEGKASAFGKVMSTIGGVAFAGLVAGAATAGAAFIKFGAESLSVADNVSDTAARLGTGAVALQKLGAAATDAGSTPARLFDAMDNLNGVIGTFVQTGGGPGAAAFKQLGIAGQITSGQIQTADQAFLAAVQAMEGIPDPSLKAQIAMQLFGKAAGPDMLKLVDVGRDGLVAYGDAAQDAGRIMSDEMVKKLSDAKGLLEKTGAAAGQMATVMAGEAIVAIVDMAKELAPLWAQTKTLWSQVAAYLLPSIKELGAAFMKFARGPAGQWLIEVLREIGQLLGTVVVVGVNLTVKAFTMLFNVVDAVGRFIANAVDKMTKAFDWLRKVTHGLINIVMPVGPAYRAMASDVSASSKDTVDHVETNFKRLPQVMTKVVTTETGKVKKAFEDLRKSYVEWSEGNNGKVKPFELGKMSDRDINTNDPKILANDYVKAMRDAAQQTKEENRRNFAETFTDGVMAALNGDLGSFFTRWWQRHLAEDLDALGARLFDWMGSPSSSGGISGLLKGIGGGIASIFGNSPKNANGGTYALKGGGGVDSRLFSSWVSPDEIIRIGSAEDFSGGAMTLQVEASPWFDVRAKEASRPMVVDYASRAAATGTQGGAALAQTQQARRQRSWME